MNRVLLSKQINKDQIDQLKNNTKALLDYIINKVIECKSIEDIIINLSQ